MHQKTPQPRLRGFVTIECVRVYRVRLLPPLSAFNLLDYNDEEAANKDEGDGAGTVHQELFLVKVAIVAAVCPPF